MPEPTFPEIAKYLLEESAADLDKDAFGVIIAVAWPDGRMALRYRTKQGGTYEVIGMARLVERTIIETEVAKGAAR